MSELDQNFHTYDTTIYMNDVLHNIQYFYIGRKTMRIHEAKLEGVVQIRKALKDDFIAAVIDEIKAAIDAENETPDTDDKTDTAGKGYNQSD